MAFNYSFDDEGATGTVQQARACGSEIIAFKNSVLDRKTITEMIASLEKSWGAIDILVNNAGISQVLPMALLEEEDWDEVMDINVKGTYIVTRQVLRGMIRRKSGRILNIGSLAGMRLIESPVHYAASKAAIRGFTEALAKEVGLFIRAPKLRYGRLLRTPNQSLQENNYYDS